MQKERFTVLLIEDNPADAKLAQLALRASAAPAFEVEWVRDLPEALSRIQQKGVDLVLTDLNLPSSAGLDTLRVLQEQAGDLPIVALTGSYLEDSLGRRAVQGGAQDYLDKQNLDARLLPRILAFAVERKAIERFQEEFLQNINHELRTPLTVASGYLRCLLDGDFGPLGARRRKVLDLVSRNVAFMTQLVEEFVEATRAGTGKLSIAPRRVDVGPLVAATAEEFRIMAQERGLALSVGYPAGLPPALADPKRCRQILFNLIANAMKFTPRGGRVALEASAPPSDPGLLRVCVADSGVGVPSEARTLIFTRLYQERVQAKEGRKGLGLGLYICNEIALRQGGRIWVESEPGKGSRFYFTLPRFSFAKVLGPLLNAVPASAGLYLAECRVLAQGHGLARDVVSRILEDASDILGADAGKSGLLLPDAACEGSSGTLYLALSGPRAGAESLAAKMQESLSSLPGLRQRGLRGAVRLVPVSCAHGRAEELEREIEGIVAADPASRREAHDACPSA